MCVSPIEGGMETTRTECTHCGFIVVQDGDECPLCGGDETTDDDSGQSGGFLGLL